MKKAWKHAFSLLLCLAMVFSLVARAQCNLAECAGGQIKHLTYPKYEHERINFFENELLKFFRL